MVCLKKKKEEAIDYRYGYVMGGGERDQCDVSDTVEQPNYYELGSLTIDEERLAADSKRKRDGGLDICTSRHTTKQQNDTCLETQSTRGEQTEVISEWEHSEASGNENVPTVGEVSATGRSVGGGDSRVNGVITGEGSKKPGSHGFSEYLSQVKMTGGSVDDSWAWTKLRYLTSSAIRAILQHLRGTRRRRLWRTVWDAKAGLPGIFGRWYCNVPWGCLTEETQRRYIAKATVWLERDQLPTEEDCWAALATVDRLNTHNFDYYRDGRGYRPIEAFTRRRDKRRWSDTSSARVAASRMDDEDARDWIGPTVGRTRTERMLHRKRKQSMTANIFASSFMRAREAYGCDVRTERGGAPAEEADYSLFTQYVARIEQLPKKAMPGGTSYTPLQRLDFDKMSRKRQMMELERIGLALDSTDAAYKLYIKPDESMYSSTHTTLAVPVLHLKSMSTADLLHHQYHMTEKIKRLAKTRREGRQEARVAVRSGQAAVSTEHSDWSSAWGSRECVICFQSTLPYGITHSY